MQKNDAAADFIFACKMIVGWVLPNFLQGRAAHGVGRFCTKIYPILQQFDQQILHENEEIVDFCLKTTSF